MVLKHSVTLLALAVCGVLANCGGDPRRDSNATPAPESIEVTQTPDRARDSIELRFRRKNLPPPFDKMMTVRYREPLFPEDANLKAAHLQSYANMPASVRLYDLYVFSPLDNYWESEYSLGHTQIPFTCAFIVHMADAGPSRVRIQAYEYLPRVIAGRRWRLLGHAGPGHYLDIRQVDPTATDRSRLLTLLETIVQPVQ
jgi:hypothetical protein